MRLITAWLSETSAPWRPAFVAGDADAPELAGNAAAAIAEVLDQRVGPLWLLTDRAGGGRRRTAPSADVDRFQDLLEAGVQFVISFNHHGHCLGFLSLGGKRSWDVYTNTDLSLLTAIAVQATLSAAAAE